MTIMMTGWWQDDDRLLLMFSGFFLATQKRGQSPCSISKEIYKEPASNWIPPKLMMCVFVNLVSSFFIFLFFHKESKSYLLQISYSILGFGIGFDRGHTGNNQISILSFMLLHRNLSSHNLFLVKDLLFHYTSAFPQCLGK